MFTREPTKAERRSWGAKGGRNRARKLSAKRRVLIARKAAFYRWHYEAEREKDLVREIVGEQEAS